MCTLPSNRTEEEEEEEEEKEEEEVDAVSKFLFSTLITCSSCREKFRASVQS